MLLNFLAPINDYDGDQIKVSNEIPANEEAGTPLVPAKFMTLGSMAIAALNTVLESEKDMSAEDKVSRASTSMVIHDSMKAEGKADISQEMVVEMKRLMNAIYAPLPIMRAYEILDPKVADVSEAK